MDKAILKVEITCNTPDKVLIKNLRATFERQPEELGLDSPNSDLLVICGSGPSLFKYYRQVAKIWPRHVVMALNGAYKALCSIGVIPQYYAQLDARPVNTNFVESPNENTTFLLASQCAPEMFDALAGQKVKVFHLNTPTTKLVFKDAGLYFGGGSTIGSTAIALGAALGYRAIAILGYDSSFVGDKSHVVDQPQNAGTPKLDVWVDDRRYISTPAMAKQVEEFRPWVRELTKVFTDLDVRLFGEGLLYDYILHGQRNSASRESEAAKYEEMYKDPNYRMPKHRAERIAEILSQRTRGTLLDVGTGRGETLDIATGLGFTAQGLSLIHI